MVEFNGAPFQYNPAITNINIDNQLAGILSQFGDDYVMDIVKDSINNRFRIYDLPRPNIANAFEITFKDLTDGFTSNTDEILNTRNRVYNNIINIICNVLFVIIIILHIIKMMNLILFLLHIGCMKYSYLILLIHLLISILYI